MTEECECSLTEMIAVIETQIGIAQSYALDEIVLLLRMARLALQMDTHAISDDELRAFSAALQSDVTYSRKKPNREQPENSTASPRARIVLGMGSDPTRDMQAKVGAFFRAHDRIYPRSRRRATNGRERAKAASPPSKHH